MTYFFISTNVDTSSTYKHCSSCPYVSLVYFHIINVFGWYNIAIASSWSFMLKDTILYPCRNSFCVVISFAPCLHMYSKTIFFVITDFQLEGETTAYTWHWKAVREASRGTPRVRHSYHSNLARKKRCRKRVSVAAASLEVVISQLYGHPALKTVKS